MDDYNKALDLSSLIEALRLNNPSCTKLILKSKQFNLANEEDTEKFCDSLQQNNTVTNLNINNNFLCREFLFFLLEALQRNTTITSLHYDKESVAQEVVITIQAGLERNRKLALERLINPQKIELTEGIWDFNSAINAAKSGDLNLLYTLVLMKPKWLHELDSYQKSLLHRAAEFGQMDCVKLLIQLKADVNLFTTNNAKFAIGTPLHKAVENNHLVIVHLLLNAGANPSVLHDGFPLLHEVTDAEIAALLVDKGVNVFARITNDNKVACHRGDTILHSLLRHQNPELDLLRFLIQKGVQVNAVNDQGVTPLHRHVTNFFQKEKDFLKRLTLLMGAGASFHSKDKDNKTPLDVAKYTKWESLTKVYLQTMQTAVIVAKERNSKNSFFAQVPDEICVQIIALTTGKSVVKPKTINKIAVTNFYQALRNEQIVQENSDNAPKLNGP